MSEYNPRYVSELETKKFNIEAKMAEILRLVGKKDDRVDKYEAIKRGGVYGFLTLATYLVTKDLGITVSASACLTGLDILSHIPDRLKVRRLNTYYNNHYDKLDDINQRLRIVEDKDQELLLRNIKG